MTLHPTNMARLADRVVPFIGGGSFLFTARISKAFHRAYTKLHRHKTTSLEAVVEETASASLSLRLDDVIAGLKGLRVGSGKPPFQSLHVRGHEKPSSIPPAALVILILSKAVKTRNAVSFTKRLAEFFDVPAAFLLLAHLHRGSSHESILHVLEMCLKQGRMEDLDDVKRMFEEFALPVDSIFPRDFSSRALVQGSVSVWKGDVAGFRLAAFRLDLSGEQLHLLHDLIYRRQPLGETSSTTVTVSLGEVLLSKCVECGQIENEKIWQWFALHWQKGEASREMFPKYISKLCEKVALTVKVLPEEKDGVMNSLKGLRDILDRFCEMCGRGFPDADSAVNTENSALQDALKGLIHEIGRLVVIFRERERISELSFLLKPLFNFLLRTKSVSLLQAFVCFVGEEAVFELLEMPAKNFWKFGNWTYKLGHYWGGCQLGAFKYLRQLRPDWRPQLAPRLRGSWRNFAVILEKWEEAEFFVFECGVSWNEILQDAFLEPCIHDQAVEAGAPTALLHDYRVQQTDPNDGSDLPPLTPLKQGFTSTTPELPDPLPLTCARGRDASSCRRFISLDSHEVRDFYSSVQMFVGGTGGAESGVPAARIRVSKNIEEVERVAYDRWRDHCPDHSESPSVSLIALNLSFPLTVPWQLGSFITAGLLHRCSCVTVEETEVMGLQSVTGASMKSLMKTVILDQRMLSRRAPPGFSPRRPLRRSEQLERTKTIERLEEANRTIDRNIEIFHRAVRTLFCRDQL
uniref:Uncharacterized protein n=1 Tax=Chromera velia CCMP2878 TaxID=1169474 RepID=A0A0G4HSI6_9ALVE|eukprot:Cvel_31100.t1-p1 / transcript=Cvel_31100.t1 / gene=Cvel_31100 / organism=Chromera_velia_CCMP2878 / gene_product=hypothetical protein / transcript_product=hypothetical protein / location=Cvel_scaffold4566:1823-4060(+) / protein_length=746 / sequence_SO=supercontig / SO=protein_coding / is_pseudo=false